MQTSFLVSGTTSVTVSAPDVFFPTSLHAALTPVPVGDKLWGTYEPFHGDWLPQLPFYLRPPQPYYHLAWEGRYDPPAESVKLAFLPVLPPWIWGLRPLPTAILEGAVFSAWLDLTYSPLVWAPRVPDWLVHRRLPTALVPSDDRVLYSHFMTVAVLGTWRPQLPDWLRGRWAPGLGLEPPWNIGTPMVYEFYEPCVDLVDTSHATTMFANGVGTSSMLLTESAARSMLTDEDVC